MGTQTKVYVPFGGFRFKKNFLLVGQKPPCSNRTIIPASGAVFLLPTFVTLTFHPQPYTLSGVAKTKQTYTARRRDSVVLHTKKISKSVLDLVLLRKLLFQLPFQKKKENKSHFAYQPWHLILCSHNQINHPNSISVFPQTFLSTKYMEMSQSDYTRDKNALPPLFDTVPNSQ